MPGARSSAFRGVHLIGGVGEVFIVIPVFSKACITGVQGKSCPFTSLICLNFWMLECDIHYMYYVLM